MLDVDAVRPCDVFAGQWWAAIGDFRGSGNAYHDNDYSQIGAGAVPFRMASRRTISLPLSR